MNKRIGTAKLIQGLYILDFHADSVTSVPHPHLSNASSVLPTLWHNRLGHTSDVKLSLLKDVLHIATVNNKDCSICPMSKQHRHAFPSSSIKSSAPFDLVHCDLWGPFSVPTYHGYQYFFTIVDDFTRLTWCHLLTHKSDVQKHLITFHKMVLTQYSTRIKILRSDNGTEFLLSDFYSREGIIHQTSCPYTPQQNGVVERKHQTLLNIARSLLFQSHLPLIFGVIVF